MLFPTLTFHVFFIAVFALVWSCRDNSALDNEWRKIILLVASWIFYGAWDWRFVALLIASGILNWSVGEMIYRTRQHGTDAQSNRTAKRWLVLGIVVNLTILGFFKYYGFFLEQLNTVLHSAGWERDLPIMQVILPVGVSFFTFQGMSYQIDMYKGDTERASLLDITLLMSFFPHLVAGPIVRPRHLVPQFQAVPRLTMSMAAAGVALILWGLFKKTVVASELATNFVDPLFFDPAAHGSLDLLLGAYGYSVQIYCDFSAYSDMAVVLASLAHLVVDLAARLRLHPAGGKSWQCCPDRTESADHDGVGGTVARGQLAIRLVGPAAGGAVDCGPPPAGSGLPATRVAGISYDRMGPARQHADGADLRVAGLGPVSGSLVDHRRRGLPQAPLAGVGSQPATAAGGVCAVADRLCHRTTARRAGGATVTLATTPGRDSGGGLCPGGPAGRESRPESGAGIHLLPVLNRTVPGGVPPRRGRSMLPESPPCQTSLGRFRRHRGSPARRALGGLDRIAVSRVKLEQFVQPPSPASPAASRWPAGPDAPWQGDWPCCF